MAVYLIGSTLCGIVFVVIGVWQMKTGSVSLLHDYHTVCVLPADKPKLAWRTGIDEVVIGILVAVGVPFVADRKADISATVTGKKVDIATRTTFGKIPNPIQSTKSGAIATTGIVCDTVMSGENAW